MTEFKVLIPDEHYDLIDFKTDDLPGVAVINSALKLFQHKNIFSWHCSIMIKCQNLIDNGMPSSDEVQILDKFGDLLNSSIKINTVKPNALFLARITWNETRELIWRIFDPEITNKFLQGILANKNYPREFDYRIDLDEKWDLAKWHL